MIARLDEARLAELSRWCWSFHRWQGGTKSVKLSKARPLEGLDERASPRSGLSPVITTSRVAALATGGMERALWLACQRKDAAMTQDQATSRFAGVTLEDTLAVRAAVARADREGRTYRLDARSPDWIGLIVAERLKLDLDDKNSYREHAIQIGKLMNIWIRTGVLVVEQRLDPSTLQLPRFVVAGKNWRLTELLTRQRALNRELRKIRRTSSSSSRKGNIDWPRTPQEPFTWGKADVLPHHPDGACYWRIKTTLSGGDELRVRADEARIMPNGDLVLIKRLEGGRERVNLAMARGRWVTVHELNAEIGGKEEI